MGIIHAMMEQYDLSEAEHQEMKAATEKDGEPTAADLLIMQYHIFTEDYADENPRIRDLHAITRAHFHARYPATVAKATEIVGRHKNLSGKGRH